MTQVVFVQYRNSEDNEWGGGIAEVKRVTKRMVGKVWLVSSKMELKPHAGWAWKIQLTWPHIHSTAIINITCSCLYTKQHTSLKSEGLPLKAGGRYAAFFAERSQKNIKWLHEWKSSQNHYLMYAWFICCWRYSLWYYSIGNLWSYIPATDSGNTLRLRIDWRGRWDIWDDRDRKCASRKRTPLHL